MSGLSSLHSSIGNELCGMDVAFIGDSITSGSGASTADTCYVSMLRKWLAWATVQSRNASTPSAGVNEYRTYLAMSPLSPAIKFAGQKRSITGGALGEYLLLVAGEEVVLDFTGDWLEIVHAKQGVDAAAAFTVYIDGASQGATSTYGVAGFGNVKQVTTAFGRHTVCIRQTAGTEPFKIEVIANRKLLRVRNGGVSGTSSADWLPTGSLLSNAVPVTATHLFIQLGTNDRGIAPKLPYALYRNLSLICGWLALNRPDTEVILMCANRAEGIAEVEGNPTVYGYGMLEVRAQIQRVAAENGLDFIDHYAMTSKMFVDGESYTTGLLHPNDAGHSAIYSNIVNAIMSAG